MRLPRFTTRRLMVLVAVAGMTFAMVALRRRSERYAEIAADFRATWQQHRDARERNIPTFVKDDANISTLFRRTSDRDANRWIEYYDARASQFENAARYPWLPVPPDPPEPE